MEHERFHALDSLRASMMLLGIWLHTVVGYSRDGGWPYKDAHPTAAFDWTLGLIHTFRMPLFMAVAGFFGALLWVKRGRAGFAANRLHRILLPFVLGWFAVMPLSLLMAAWSRTGSLGASLAFFTSGAFVPHLHPGHLWFLEYLLVLYAVAWVAVPLLARLPGRLLSAANDGFRGAVRSAWAPILFGVPSAVTLSLMRHGFLEDPPGFVPVPRIVLAYALPFAFGWALYLNRDLLHAMEQRAWPNTIAAAALFAGWLAFVAPHERALGEAARYARAGAGGLLLWLLILGLTGLFLKYAAAERPAWRYLSDGSYWMYVVHMPVVMAFQIALAGVAVATEAKVLAVASLSFLTLVASYDLIARPTWIGVLLNGRRHPRGLVAVRATSRGASDARTAAAPAQAAACE
jgi:peptidoglycan/LPS O-acetylase OafA/YrhL